MFKHILIPTDGSDLSNAAVVRGVQFAKEVGARITGLTVSPPYRYLPSYSSMQFSQSEERYAEDVRHNTQRNLQTIQDQAEALGVPCNLVTHESDHPHEEIVKTAEECGCDVIFMASHGRRGIRAMVMGSETNKVLTHTKIPVLVFR